MSWNEPGYSDIVEVHRRGGEIEVVFADGAVISLEAEALGIDEDATLRVNAGDPTGLEMRVGGRYVRRVPWELLRAMTNADFADALRAREREEAAKVGRRLRALREDLGLKQGAVAQRAGMTAPQLAKIEKGESDLRYSTIATVLASLGGSWEDLAGPSAPEVGRDTLAARLKTIGLDAELVHRIADHVDRRALVATLARAFDQPAEALISGQGLEAKTVGMPVRFKNFKSVPADPDPMLVAARLISEVVVRNVRLTPNAPDIHGLAEAAASASAATALEQVCDWAWSTGIAVIPLHGRGGFVGAAWRIDERPVILLKEARAPTVFWLFDLAHEIAHHVLGHVTTAGVVDESVPTGTVEGDPIEVAATTLALDMLLPDHASAMSDIRHRAQGDGPRLFKPVVQDVARQMNRDPALLAMAAAHQLRDVAREKDRWGSAQNLAKQSVGRPIVEAALSRRLRLGDVAPEDRGWIRALTFTA